MKNILLIVSCLIFICCNQQASTPSAKDFNSDHSNNENTDGIRRKQAKENFDEASFEVFKNKEVVNILSVKYNLPSNHLNDILTSYTESVNTIDLDLDSEKYTEHIKNYAFELGIEEKDFADLLLEYLSAKKKNESSIF